MPTQPYVSDPQSGTSSHTHSSNDFTVKIDNVPGVYSWKVEIGFSPGANDIYVGTEILITDGYVDHNFKGLPGAGSLCYTKVKYRKAAGGPWYDGGSATTFTCV